MAECQNSLDSYDTNDKCVTRRRYFSRSSLQTTTALEYADRLKENGSSSKISITYKSLSNAVVTVNVILQKILGMKHIMADIPSPFIIGIYCKCPLVTATCMLGIMKYGASFYIPEDLTLSKLSGIINKVQPAIFFIHKLMLNEIEHLFMFYEEFEFSIFNEVILVATFHYDVKEKAQLKSDCNYSTNNEIAYVMTTSGSTGVPKLVFVSHNCIVPNIKDFIKLFVVTENDVILGVSPLTFDPSIIDIFISLSCGACLIMMPSNVINKVKIIDQIFSENQVTILQATPSFFTLMNPDLLKNELLADGDRSLKVLALGGEEFPLPRTFKQRLGKKCNTKIFNLYGITELSCWASFHEVNIFEYCDQGETLQGKDDANAITRSDRSLTNIISSCPLGKPLSKTAFKIVDDEGKSVENQIGNIILSGERVEHQTQIEKLYCENDSIDEFLHTGDLGYFYNNKLYYIDRNDNIVKRKGYKISLAEIEYVAKDIDTVYNCCAISWKHNICLYIVLKNGYVVAKAIIKNHMKLILPLWKLPDEIFFIDELPISRNGKVDKQNLIKKYKSLYDNNLVNTYNHEITMQEVLQYAHDCSEMNMPQNMDNFINFGGNSLEAITFFNKIQNILDKECPLLLQTIFNGSFKDIHDLITNCKLKRNYSHISQNDPSSSFLKTNKCLKTDSQAILYSHFEVSLLNISDISIFSTKGHTINGEPCLQYVNEIGKDIAIAWKIDLGKCIDASPLVVSTMGKKICFIGCHSHKFSSIDIDSGTIIWTTILPDRIESSAAVSADIKKIFIGCYDGILYCMNFYNGDIIWKFSTQDMIKCTPIFDNRTQSLYFGSYDKYLYCLDEYGNLKWKYNISEGSILSSPVILKEKVYSATLDGYISCNDINTGCCIWKVLISKPIFGSLVSFRKGIVFGCVDHNVYCYSLAGKLNWKFSTSGPIFSSPCVLNIYPADTCKSSSEIKSDFALIAIGSHDHCLYLLNESGILLQKWTLSSPIYATPYLTLLSSLKAREWNDEPFLRLEIRGMVCETEGIVVFFSYKYEPSNIPNHSESNLKLKKIAGQIFSSPVLVDNRLLVGCRDNNLYCLNIF